MVSVENVMSTKKSRFSSGLFYLIILPWLCIFVE
nr:MAG TPA: hypothetical protein [Bacteriophage sp.]